MKFQVILAVILGSAIISGCKIEIQVPSGGAVVSESGAYTCSSGSTCSIDVVDIFFDDGQSKTYSPNLADISPTVKRLKNTRLVELWYTMALIGNAELDCSVCGF